jgi:hypothetical protein
MYLIDGQPYIDLTNEIDFDGLMSIEKEIAYGIAKSRSYLRDTGAGTINCYDKNVPSLQDMIKKIHNPDTPDYEYYKKLEFNLADCLLFAKYNNVYQSMGQSLSLRDFTSHALKSKNWIVKKSDSVAFTDSKCFSNFPSLKKWIENLKIFDETGRIVFFINAPGELHSVHKDTFVGHVDNFILINLHLDRKTIFIYDDETKQTLDINSRAFVFDVRNWHGSNSTSHSWSLRIDGKFNPTWARAMGFWDCFDTSKRIAVE